MAHGNHCRRHFPSVGHGLAAGRQASGHCQGRHAAHAKRQELHQDSHGRLAGAVFRRPGRAARHQRASVGQDQCAHLHDDGHRHQRRQPDHVGTRHFRRQARARHQDFVPGAAGQERRPALRLALAVAGGRHAVDECGRRRQSAPAHWQHAGARPGAKSLQRPGGDFASDRWRQAGGGQPAGHAAWRPAGDLEYRPPQHPGNGARCGRSGVGDRARAQGRRRAEPDRRRAELRLAAAKLRARLPQL